MRVVREVLIPAWSWIAKQSDTVHREGFAFSFHESDIYRISEEVIRLFCSLYDQATSRCDFSRDKESRVGDNAVYRGSCLLIFRTDTCVWTTQPFGFWGRVGCMRGRMRLLL